MKSFIWRMTLKLKRKPYWTQILILYTYSFLFVFCALPLLLIANLLLGENTNGPEISTIKTAIFAITLGPFLETFLNQYLPFVLMQKLSWTRNKYGFYIFTSAFVFGLCHTYSIQYMIFGFSIGLIFGFSYFFFSKTPTLAFWSTTLIHSAHNGLAILFTFMADKT